MAGMSDSALLLDQIIDDLAQQGWSQRMLLSSSLTAELAAECRTRLAEGSLTLAGVGRGATNHVEQRIRGDRIQWLEPGQSAATDRFLAWMDELRHALNRSLYLGLEDIECHFACYGAGAFYQRHVDRFRDDDRRTVTVVFYLNENWQPEDGGQLRLYLSDTRAHDVLPEAGTLVVFMSADWPHEVLTAHRERLSVTGWFRRRAVL